jgi:hypothetical protein
VGGEGGNVLVYPAHENRTCKTGAWIGDLAGKSSLLRAPDA